MRGLLHTLVSPESTVLLSRFERFTDLHRKAIGYPENQFVYIGIKPEGDLFDHAKAVSGELVATQSFESDLYGCHSHELAEKKDKRNPFRRSIPYLTACPELIGLLNWCGPGVYQNNRLPLPWGGGGGKDSRSSSGSSSFYTSADRMNRFSANKNSNKNLRSNSI